MDYKISDLKLKNSFFNHLNSTSELDAMGYGNFNEGNTVYYPTYWNVVDEFGDYESAPMIFTYYPSDETYEFMDTYENNEFPLIELNNDIYERLISIFGDVVVHKLMPEWFKIKYGLDVNNVFSE